ncbi:NAD(P)H-hydrate dehydratase [Parapedobacter lycopersici]|uniref:NAD(P)H-hydrate dehydratase n=1 Tax=Parapedobacter lycopersici TaxID=1864939 RepID=UPI00333EEF6A
MKSILTAKQMRAADQHTIETAPISAIDLMENAAAAFVAVTQALFTDKHIPILICCGTGNNGGDGLAAARLLQVAGYDSLHVWVARFSSRESDDFAMNLHRLRQTPIPVTEWLPGDGLPPITQDVIVDALLGSGLNKPLAGDWLRLARHINQSQQRVIAIDVPTGMRADGVIPDTEETVFAHDVVTFQRPKISFFFPESARAMHRFHVADIGLDETFIEQLPTGFKLIEAADVRRIYRPRKPFTHKGTYGHALIVAGSEMHMGAALLSCGGCLFSGAGRTTACIPVRGLAALNTRYPEVMYSADSALRDQWEAADAVGIGPGLGNRATQLAEVVDYPAKPLVLDADALNWLSEQPALLDRLPEGCILTPHMKEFDRLFGRHTDWWSRVQTAKEKAARYRLIIILKNRYTFIVTPEGHVLINPTGNAAMATGGMGDVLTGMLVAFLAQRYTPVEAAILACYTHGAAGDRLRADRQAVILPTQLIEQIPSTLYELTNNLDN